MPMNSRKLMGTLAGGMLAVGLTACSSQRLVTSGPGTSPVQIEGDTYRLERAYLVTVHIPNADVDKVLESVVTAVGLDYGKYDQVAYLDASGLEQFRPRAGSKASARSGGPEPSARMIRTQIVGGTVDPDDT